MKILCTGDIHIGRRSSRLPEHLDGRAHSCAEAWGRIVEHALAERVDVVALSGDIVDRENRYYEALGPLERGIRRLSEAGIVTVAVAGNHDHDVFPRLADALDDRHFRFLGRGGRWERLTIRRGGDVLHVVGWSFPGPYMRTSPLDGLATVVGGVRGTASGPSSGASRAVESVVSGEAATAADGGAPGASPHTSALVLGLLHADLDQPGSPHAPITLAELRAAPVDFWLLGHVHAPQLHEDAGAAPVLYPGSPQAMDPGEVGAHGVWIVEIDAGRRFHARQLPLSSVRYDTIEVDVDGVTELAEFDSRVTGAVRAHVVAVGAEARSLRCMSCRLRIVGRTPLHRLLDARVRQLCADLELDDGGVSAVVERAELATRPARDLVELARGNDPVGVLARLLLTLERGAPEGALDGGAVGGHERLLRAAVACMDEVDRARPYLTIADEAGDFVGRATDRGAGVSAGGAVAGSAITDATGPGRNGTHKPEVDDATRRATRALARQASLLLDELLAQKEGA